MTHHEISRILAVVVLVVATFIFVVDVAENAGSVIALKIKWSLGWTIMRYLGITCAVLLALDVFF